MSGLKEKFCEKACPADLPMYDSGIDAEGINIPFSKVLQAAAPHADVLVVGDTNHYNPEIRGILKEPENLAAVRDAGFTHIGVETSSRMQHWVEKFNDGALTRQEFEGKIDLSLFVAQGNEDGAWTRQVGTMAEFSKDNNIRFEFVDPENGNQICDEALPDAEYQACDIQKWKDRFQDDALATHLDSNVQEGGKGLLLYGAAHFSVDNGSRDGIDGNVVKIDVYQNRQQYEADKEGLKQNTADGINTNSIKPDMVYFKDTQTLYTTVATDPALREDLHRAAEQASPDITAPVPAMPAPREQQLNF